MIKPLLELKNYPHAFSDILKKFEAGRPLSCDQLHFLEDHERALSNSTLDPVLRYYLTEHKLRPHKALPLELPQPKLTKIDFEQIRHRVHLLLRNNLSQVDLAMTPEQFLQFKKVGAQELVFWHGNHFLSSNIFYQGGMPCRLYFQWGRMFGIVKLQIRSCGKTMEGKILIFFEEMYERNLRECIQAYTQQLTEEQKEYNKQMTTLRQPEQQQHSYHSPTLEGVGVKPEKCDQ